MTNRWIELVRSVLVAAPLVVGGCLPSSEFAQLPPTTPVAQAEPPKEPTPPPRPVNSRCIDLAKDGTLRAQLPPMPSSGEKQVAPVTADLPHMLEVYREIEACRSSGDLADDAAYANAIRAMHGVVARWYEAAPGSRGAILGSDGSELIRRNDEVSVAAPMPGLSEATCLMGIRMQSIGPSPDVLAQVQRFARAPDPIVAAAMRTDACAGATIAVLKQQVGSAGPDTSLDQLLGEQAAALKAESELWSKLLQRSIAQSPNEHPSLPLAAGEKLRLDTRVYRVSSYIRQMSGLWGPRGDDDLRNRLGLPYGHYLEELARGVEDGRKSRDGAAYPSTPAPTVQWVAPLDDLSKSGMIFVDRVTLDRLAREVAADGYNVRGTMKLREATWEWNDVLRHDRNTPATQVEITSATRLLVDAARQVGARGARVALLAKLLKAVPVIDGRSGEASQNKDAGKAEDLMRVRKLASRQLGEAALCILNKSYLARPESIAKCEAVVEATSMVSSSAGPVCAPRSPDMSTTSDPLPLLDDLRAAYQSAIAAIDINWPGVDAPADAPTPRPATICELQQSLHQDVLGRIGVELGTYDLAVRMYSSGRLAVDPQAVGPLVASAINLARSQRTEMCNGTPGVGCRASALGEAAERAKKGTEQSEARVRLDSYCHTSRLAAAIFESATRPRSTGSLIEVAAADLRPLSAAELVAHGELFNVEAAACRSPEPPKGAPGRRGERRPPTAPARAAAAPRAGGPR